MCGPQFLQLGTTNSALSLLPLSCYLDLMYDSLCMGLETSGSHSISNNTKHLSWFPPSSNCAQLELGGNYYSKKGILNTLWNVHTCRKSHTNIPITQLTYMYLLLQQSSTAYICTVHVHEKWAKFYIVSATNLGKQAESVKICLYYLHVHVHLDKTINVFSTQILLHKGEGKGGIHLQVYVT